MQIFRLSTAGLLISPLFWLSVQAAESLPFRSGDVVAFLGGSDVVGAQFNGYLEALLTIGSLGGSPVLPRTEGVRFRSFAWEGDTVYAQPREIGFPNVHDLLKSNAVNVAILQFGRIEALEGAKRLPEFKAAYAKLLEKCFQQTSRLILVTPPPYESPGGFLPDLGKRNTDLESYVRVTAELANQNKLPLIDIFHELGGTNHHDLKLTDNGLQLTERGHASVAEAFARQAAIRRFPSVLTNAGFERLRQAIIAKNKLWFDYSRPQNWAFLGGDRVSVPSSRDHVDPKVRWFPAEMQKFLPLIEAKEKEIAELAQELAGGSRGSSPHH